MNRWNDIVSAYTSFKDNVLETMSELGPPFEGETTTNNEAETNQESYAPMMHSLEGESIDCCWGLLGPSFFWKKYCKQHL